MITAFLITWRSLWRGKTLWILLAAVVAAHFLLPGLVRSDGSAAGRLEMHVRVVCGTVSALMCVASLALACGSFARERDAELLPLVLVRPISAFSVAVGRWLALVVLVGVMLAVNAALVNVVPFSSGLTPPDCKVHHSPSLPPAEVAAAEAMAAFLASERTPEAVKKAPRAAVLALLTAKENERYEVVRPGKSISLPFDVPAGERLAARTRFSTMYNTRMALNGIFRYRDCEGTVSNSTQAILDTPLVPRADILSLTVAPGAGDVLRDLSLTFTNTGRSDVMLRPRRDVELLAPGDSFFANSLRATGEMMALAGLLAAFGFFLSAALSRPVALFTAVVLLSAALMAPDAVSQFPDEFQTTAGEKAGLAISRAVTRFTAALSEISPVSDLASGRAIPMRELIGAIVADMVAWPCIFLGLSAFVLRRKVR